MKHSVRGGDASVLRRADLDPHMRTGGRASGAEHFLPGHDHLHRLTRFARQRQCHGLQINHGLAAEAAADFRRGDTQLGNVHSQQLGAVTADNVVPLGGAPKLRITVVRDVGKTCVGLDVSLVHGICGELALDDHVGRGEAGLQITLGKFDALSDIGRLRRLRFHTGCNQTLMEQRRVRLHRVHDIDNMRQRLVLHLD